MRLSASRRHVLSRGLVLGGVSGAALLGCGVPGATDEKPAAITQPTTVRWPEYSGPLEVEFAEAFNKKFNAKYGPMITAVNEPFPDLPFEKWIAMAVAG